MTPAEEWASLNASAPPAQPSLSSADEWASLGAAPAAAPKPMGPVQPLNWFERILSKMPDSFASTARTEAGPAMGTALGASIPGRAAMGAMDMGAGAVQLAGHLTGDPDVDKRIQATQAAYEASRGDAGTDWPRIGGDVATGFALPVGKLEQGANFVNRLIHAEKVAIPLSLSQPVDDTGNFWTEKVKQGLVGAVGTAIGQPAAEMGAKIVGSAANKVINFFRPKDGTIAALTSASPELQAAIQKAQAEGKQLDPQVLNRQIEADSLPIKMSLTPGQAKQDPVLISSEMNLRGKNQEIAYKLNDQNKALIDNLNAIRTNVAPEAAAPDHVIAGQNLIDSLTAADTAKRQQVSALYGKLKEANGGSFPVDGVAFTDAADAALKSEMKQPFLPTQVRSIMEGFASGKQQMTYENFENLRTILASEGRKAERAGDGNTAAAVNVVRNALESLPMTGEAANVKPLADAARQAARDRFDQIDQTPALKAVVNGDAVADNFIQKHVVGGSKEGLMNLAATLKDDPVALQTMKAGVVNYLGNSAGVSNGNFSQAGYNKALAAVKPKLSILFNDDEAKVLDTLGSVARYAQAQPRGSFVNNSNTDVAAVARGAAAHAADTLTGTPIPGMLNRGVTSMLEKKANMTRLGEILNPGAGVASPGATQQFLTTTFPKGAGQYATIPLASMLSQASTNRGNKRPGERQ